jgi:hypothetical protein
LPISADLKDRAVLVVSELTTNAVLHCRGGFLLSVEQAGEWLRMQVTDRSHSLPKLRHADLLDGHGLGLQIVAKTADHWGATQNEEGKVVWAELGVHQIARRRPARVPSAPRAGDSLYTGGHHRNRTA